jgi:hypothetical protein
MSGCRERVHGREAKTGGSAGDEDKCHGSHGARADAAYLQAGPSQGAVRHHLSHVSYPRCRRPLAPGTDSRHTGNSFDKSENGRTCPLTSRAGSG